MESEAQWKEIIELTHPIHAVAETVLNRFFENAEEMKPHIHSPELFLSSFKKLLTHKNESTHEKKKTTKQALQRVRFTTDAVEAMRREIEKDRENILRLAEEAKQCSENIMKEKEEVIEVSKRLEEAQQEENDATRESRRLAEECEAELAAVMPAIEKALQSLDLLKPKDIAEIKSMRNPPAVVKLVIAAVAVMLQVEPDLRKNDREELWDLYWGPATKMLGEVNFMKRLLDYDKDNIPDSVMESLRNSFYNHPNFEPTRVARANVASESLCRWVIAMEKYDKVSKEILRPKREALAKAQEQLGQTLQLMKKDRSKLSATEQKVYDLEVKLNETLEKKQVFEDDLDKKDRAIGRAKELIAGLTIEATKWAEFVDSLRKRYDTMVGDAVLSCASLTFLGPLPEEARKEALTEWATLIATSKEKTKCSELDQFSIHKFVNEPVAVESWRICDFPQDPYWLDNATMVVVNCTRQLWPLCVDPLGIANKWIKSIEKDRLQVVKPGDENFIETLKSCATEGKSLLLEDITEKLDNQLEPLLTRQITVTSPTEKLKLGEADVPIHKDFRFYMTTRIRQVKPFFYFTPDVGKEQEANFILVNFVPPNTDSLALQHALLSGVVAKEKRKLEAERLATISKVATNRVKYLEIGDKVLGVLSNPEGGRLVSIDMTLTILEAKKPLTEMEEQMKEDDAAMKKVDSSLDPFRKLTNKLAKKFCAANENEAETPFDLEAFINRAL